MEQVINTAFDCVKKMSMKFNIDESHSLKHSMEVYKFAKAIYHSEVEKNIYLKEQVRVIFAAAILHDMCDHKYIKETTGMTNIKDGMCCIMTMEELNIMEKIITTMSYSKVKQCGYPDLGTYQLAYHIVREADLLAAYDIDRCIIFGMMVDGLRYVDAVITAEKLFANRVLKYIEDKLFVTTYSIHKASELHQKALL